MLSGQARLWFTIGFGIVNEVYYPRVDLPQIRDLGFIVAGPDGFWSEVKRNENYTLRLLAPGVPAVEIVHEHPRYTLRLRVTPDPRRDVLVVACQLDPVRDGGEISASTFSWRRISARPATTMSRWSNATARAAC